ncbi:MAG: hypothetical protein H6Q04_2513, partial [Acidobacteria bacterium]|nr:hypothetical protein [Acidobacteriota bacterium]
MYTISHLSNRQALIGPICDGPPLQPFRDIHLMHHCPQLSEPLLVVLAVPLYYLRVPEPMQVPNIRITAKLASGFNISQAILVYTRCQCGSPPHAWGQSVCPLECAREMRFTPTRVGTIRRHGRPDIRRFTPTRVGTISFAVVPCSNSPVHPHTRGDNLNPNPQSTSRSVIKRKSLHGHRNRSGKSWTCLFICVALTGVRLGELLALQWKYVDLKSQVLRVAHSLYKRQLVAPKTVSSARTIPMGNV